MDGLFKTGQPPQAPPGYKYVPSADGWAIEQDKPGIDGAVTNWAMDNPIDAAALGATVIPGVGDVVGLANDLRHYATNPEERRWQNYALTGIGLLPFLPPAMPFSRAVGKVSGAKQTAERGGEAVTYEADPSKRDMLAQLLRGSH